MRLSVTVTKIQYDVKGIVTATFKALRGQMLIAASKFVHEAAQAVPIDTGMARGSFLNLLQLLDSNSDKPDEGVIKMGSLGDYARAIPDGIPTEAQKEIDMGTILSTTTVMVRLTIRPPRQLRNSVPHVDR